ncbi:hypothetical protein [Anaplasma platys]|nr:hypothetical protein [Anaplasma platys]
MSGLSRTVFGVTDFLFVIFCVVICYCATSSTTSVGNQVDDNSFCRTLYQSLSDEPMREALDPEAVEVGRLKICGASPSCNSCVEMRPGDCGYVFPSNVLVYPSKKKGYEEICACTVFACSLPWDPVGWSKKCMEELGCYQKPLFRGIGEFPAALCSGDSGDYVKFLPMAFSLQSYFSPGVVARLYDKRHGLKKEQYVWPKHISDEYLGIAYEHQGRQYGGQPLVTSSSVSNSDHAQHWNPKDIDKGKNELNLDNGVTFYYFAYRRPDLLCIRNYGKNKKLQGEKFVESCLPVPGLDLPIWYGVPPDNNAMTETYLLRNLYSTTAYREALDRSRNERSPADTSEAAKQQREIDSATINAFNDNMKQSRGRALMVGLSMDYSYSGRGLDNKAYVKRACIAPCHVEYKTVAAESGRKNQVYFELFENPDKSKVLPGIYPSVSGIRAFRGFPARGVRSDKWTMKVKFADFREGCRLVGSYPLVGNVEGGDVAQSGEQNRCLRVFNEWGQSKSHYAGYVACVEKSVIASDREFEVLQRTQCEAHDGDVTENLCTEVVRVRKKPKMLRRYILINSGGVEKRVRCDDRYDIDIRTLGQNVLNKAEIVGNMFKFSREYLGVHNANSDPCASSEYDVVYFYEDGGFLTDVDLQKCGTPVEEFYAPGKSVTGCEYSYVRTDDYRPYLASVPKRGSNASITPLSRYEQGLCVDNFSSTWFVPSYKSGETGGDATSKATTGLNQFCKWDECKIGPYTEVRKVYRYPIVEFEGAASKGRDAREIDFLFGNGGLGCSLYKVEMWGGGQAAVLDEKSNKKRSGRPGQYAMLVLDFKGLQSNSSTYSQLSDVQLESALGLESHSAIVHSLVMSIGEGGIEGKGEDTILYLCSRGIGHQNSSSFGEKCYEIARAVGGGSDKDKHRRPPRGNAFVAYYRTIIGDVLEDDVGAISLMENHSAMFTKFSLTMNLELPSRVVQEKHGQQERIKKILENRHYFDGRSLPGQFCEYKEKRSSPVKIFVPGMGGCWSESGDHSKAKPGVGENGAVMITCERWGVSQAEHTSVR